MGLRNLEAMILRELRAVAGKSKIRQKDIMEWRTGKEVEVQEGETYYYLPDLQISVAVKLPAKSSSNPGEALD